MVIIDKKTRQRIVADRMSGDVVVKAKSQSTALNVDVVPVIGGWTDSDKTKGGQPTKQLMFFPRGDEFFGQDVWIEGARKKELDNLGNRKGTTRQRTRYIYTDLKDSKNI